MTLIEEIRLGIIGAGGIGSTHLRSWQANGITPVAIADARQETLDDAIANYGGTGFNDGAALIASGLVNVVSICTPPKWHAELAIAALDAGIAVICEKPLAKNLEQAQQIADAVERTGGTLTVGFCHRFQPHIEKLKAMIDNGDLGMVMTVRNRFGGHKQDAEKTWFASKEIAGGGVMSDTSIHSIDLVRHLIGDPQWVQALVSTRETPLGPELEVDDTSVMTVKTASGTLGIIDASWRTPPGEWSVTVYGTNGTAVVDYNTLTLKVQDIDKTWREIEVEPGDRIVREIAHFIEVVTRGVPQRVTVQDGLWANRILDAGYRANASATTV